MKERRTTPTQRALNLWAVILIVWSIYRAYFKLPEWFDEFIAKPIVFVLPVFIYIKTVEKKEIFSSKLPAALVRFYPATADIQVKATIPKNAVGEEPDTWADVVGLTDLPCQLAPATKGEIKKADMTIVIATHVISFPRYYSTITELHRAVVAGVSYDILLVRHDSHSKRTSLWLQVVR